MRLAEDRPGVGCWSEPGAKPTHPALRVQYRRVIEIVRELGTQPQEKCRSAERLPKPAALSYHDLRQAKCSNALPLKVEGGR